MTLGQIISKLENIGSGTKTGRMLSQTRSEADSTEEILNELSLSQSMAELMDDSDDKPKPYIVKKIDAVADTIEPLWKKYGAIIFTCICCCVCGCGCGKLCCGKK